MGMMDELAAAMARIAELEKENAKYRRHERNVNLRARQVERRAARLEILGTPGTIGTVEQAPYLKDLGWSDDQIRIFIKDMGGHESRITDRRYQRAYADSRFYRGKVHYGQRKHARYVIDDLCREDGLGDVGWEAWAEWYDSTN